ncbi:MULTISPECIES: YadA-like family protein [unclassified Citrobacter]|uniref:YadA-like family protein n=1 Tax=unclassified Citrobacter TaxID=2644389 RepID=UPI0025789AC1|nr:MULTISPECIES: YadA-like family protein [unclassified Citrobacter]MDM2993787.1 YadA-like family protein [Citrobacter sp. CK195]MDM3131486.1 YadA-like family protein [Citrobacter sp. CK205]
MHKNVMASMLGVVLFGALSNISWAEEQIDPNKTITRGELNNELIELARSLSQKGENYRNEVVRYVNGRVNDAANTTKNYINEQINAQNRSLASQRDAINTVKQDVTVSVGKVNKELDEQKDVLRGEIGQAKADAIAQADNNAKVVRGELKQQGDSLRGEIGSAKRDAYARADSNAKAVRGELKQQGDSLRGEIGSVKRDAYARIDNNTEAVRGELSQTSKYLSGKINANQSAASKNSRRLDLHESWQKMATDRMNGLQKQISNNRKEIRESAAQNAALAGLFQPYSVGKFNATAALGGYSDKQAVAVGIGYRFTDNVAGKMAVAAGGDSVSWNTGISLEF